MWQPHPVCSWFLEAAAGLPWERSEAAPGIPTQHRGPPGQGQGPHRGRKALPFSTFDILGIGVIFN